jgi:hypothetical protein
MDGAGKVFARITELTADAKHKIAEGKLRYVSAEIYENDKRDENAPPYLKAIALLGRDTPAVAGTKITLFSRMTGGGLAVMETGDEKIAVFTRKADTEEIKDFSGGGRKTTEANMIDEKEVERLKAEFAAQQEKLAAFMKENSELKASGRKAESEAYFAKLRDEGKLAPALFEKAVALDAKLGDAERQELRAVFSGLGESVNLTGDHAAPKERAAGNTPGDDGKITAKIHAYKLKHNFRSFSEAAEALYAENPALFEGEGGAA